MQKHPITELDHRKLLAAPSILAADFAKLGDEIKRVEDAGADLIHIDIMDAHFVPNLTIGPSVVKSIRKITSLPFDVHLMLTNPLPFVKPFAEAGADNITFHIECNNDIEETIAAIRNEGCSVGLSLRPKTQAETIIPYLEKIDLVLVMTVEPGFGGQSFMADMMPKVKKFREAINKTTRPVHLEVDGGIDSNSVYTVAKTGANMMVAGTYIFRHPEGADIAIKKLRVAQKEVNKNF